MRGPKQIAYQGKFSAVVRTERSADNVEFDVWRWNLLKRKWVRMTGSACGYAALEDARPICDEIDEESVAAVLAGRDVPPLT